MSHVAKIEIEIKDLDALDAACKRLGFVFQHDKKTFAWFGRHVGDYPLPEGFEVADMGRCEHAIKVPGASYEVGVVKRRDGRPGYTLLWDFYSAGNLERHVGPNGQKLVQAYGVETATRAARRQGYSVTESTREDGSIMLKVRGS